MKPKAPSDLLARFRKTAEQPKPMAVAAPEVESPAPRAKPKMVRYTLDLEPAQHRFLKRFALEAGVDASRVLRALLRRLEEDTALSNAVMQELNG